MPDDADLPDVNQILDSAVHELNQARNMLSKTASRLHVGWRPVGLPLTGAQSQARTATLSAIDDAKAAIDRAKGALRDAPRTDDPPRP